MKIHVRNTKTEKVAILKLPMDHNLLEEKLEKDLRGDSGGKLEICYDDTNYCICYCQNIYELNKFSEEYKFLSQYDQAIVDYLIIEHCMDFMGALTKKDDYIFEPQMDFNDLVEKFIDDEVFGEISGYLRKYLNLSSIKEALKDKGYDYIEGKGVFITRKSIQK